MTLEKFDSGMHYILVEENTVKPFLERGAKRAICTIENVDFHCAFMQKKESGYFINIGSKICKQLNLKMGDEVKLLGKTHRHISLKCPKNLQKFCTKTPTLLSFLKA
jgi:ABC-type lipoprotein release transport system permease subunit